jgi:hypothetical protein
MDNPEREKISLNPEDLEVDSLPMEDLEQVAGGAGDSYTCPESYTCPQSYKCPISFTCPAPD